MSTFVVVACLNGGEFSSSHPSCVILELGTTAIHFGPEGSSNEIEVISDIGWEASSIESWLNIVPSDSSILVSALPNGTPDGREGRICVKAGERTSFITAYQDALSTSISISNQSVSSKASSLSETVRLTANYPFTIKVEGNDSEWLSIALPDPLQDGVHYPAGNDIPITLCASIPDESRTATVKFSVPDMSCTLRVSQMMEDMVITVDFCNDATGKVKQPFTTNIPTSKNASVTLGAEEIPYILKVGDIEYPFAIRCPVSGTNYYISLTSSTEYGIGMFVKGGGTAATLPTYMKLPQVPGRRLSRVEFTYGLTPVADYPLCICSDASSFVNAAASSVAELTANVNVSRTDTVELDSSKTKTGVPYYIVFGSTIRFFLSHLKLIYN